MASNRRRFVVRHPVVIGIGCCWRKPKLPSFLSNLLPKLKLFFAKKKQLKPSKILRISPNFSSSATTTTTTTTITSSSSSSYSPSFGIQKIMGSAVVKRSDEPYIDFRNSMSEVILEMEIDTCDGLLDLVNQFVALNKPCHHPYIMSAFSAIWNEVYLQSASSTPGRC